MRRRSIDNPCGGSHYTPATEQLVTVIIPAYNAAQTIDETLRSVRAQTHANLQVLVVDDGSTDETAAVVRQHAAQDGRIQLLSQKNGGVARARNLALEQTKGAFVAPIDADDLWRPEKISEQVLAMEGGGERIGLVYTWFAVIDDAGKVIDTHYRPVEQGNVLRRMYRGNLVGNGSSPLMRTAAVLEAGGYDPTLRDRKAQGCEDMALYARIAGAYDFMVVPRFLTGYRQTEQSMSSDVMQMVRSWDLVAADLRKIHPDYQAELAAGRASILRWLFRRSLHPKTWRIALRVWIHMAERRPVDALQAVLSPFHEGLDGARTALRRRLFGEGASPDEIGPDHFRVAG